MNLGRKSRRGITAGEIFLSLLAVGLIFVHSRGFLRPFDDPKELLLYAGTAVFGLPMFLIALRSPLPGRLDVLQLLLILFVLYLPLNLLFARPPLNEGLAAAGKYVLLVLLFFALAQRDLASLIRIWQVLLAGSSLAALMIFFGPSQGFHQPPIGHISYQSDFFAWLIPWSFFLLGLERGRWRAWGHAVAGILLTTVVVAGARKTAMASLVASGLVLAIFGWIFGRAWLRKLEVRRIVTALLAGALTMGLLFLAKQVTSSSSSNPTPTANVLDRYDEMVTEYRSWGAINIRYVIAKRTLEAAAERPVQGFGYGSFRFLYPRFYREGDREAAIFDRQSPHWLMHPHNELLYQLFEGGVIGTLLALAPVLLLVIFLGRALKRHPSTAPGLICLSLASFLVLAITGSFNTSLAHPLLRFALILQLALGYRLIREDLPHYTLPAVSRPVHLTMKGIALAVLLCAAVVVTGHALSSYFLRQQWFDVAERLAPRAYDVLSRAASEHLAKRQWTAAEQRLAMARREFPYVPQILLKSAHLYLRQDKYHEARQVLQRAYGYYPFYQPIAELYHRHVKPE